MDADKRHQLKQNELAGALARVSTLDFTDRRVLYPTLVILVAAILLGAYKFRQWQQSKSAAQTWTALIDVGDVVPERVDAQLASLRSIIQSAPDRSSAAMARLRLTSALIANGNRTANRGQLDEALAELKLLTGDPAAPSAVRAAAWYNTGLALESKREFDSAEKVYEQLANDPEFVGSPFREIASDRRTRLKDFREPVHFVPGLAPAPGAASRPAADVNATQPATTQPAEAAGRAEPAQPASSPTSPP